MLGIQILKSLTTKLHTVIGGVQPFSRDLKGKENFVMLDEIRIANMENLL